ncbi:MAG: hypothetical protein LBI28_03080 [Treponema sp.]|nr:hypothetical protein [Treponema sp.]
MLSLRVCEISVPQKGRDAEEDKEEDITSRRLHTWRKNKLPSLRVFGHFFRKRSLTRAYIKFLSSFFTPHTSSASLPSPLEHELPMNKEQSTKN